MISLEELKTISKKLKIDESVVAREYIQILFLNELYSQSFSEDIFFKGGTAIRLIYAGTRFSEDLDFTVNMNGKDFEESLNKFLLTLSNKYLIKWKEKESVAGKTYLLTATIPGFKTDIFVRLDFSFRERVFEPQKKILKADYPILLNSFIQVLSIDEIIGCRNTFYIRKTQQPHTEIQHCYAIVEKYTAAGFFFFKHPFLV